MGLNNLLSKEELAIIERRPELKGKIINDAAKESGLLSFEFDNPDDAKAVQAYKDSISYTHKGKKYIIGEGQTPQQERMAQLESNKSEGFLDSFDNLMNDDGVIGNKLRNLRDFITNDKDSTSAKVLRGLGGIGADMINLGTGTYQMLTGERAVFRFF